MKIGLVLEGGAMRGMFTAGVLDTFLDNDIKMDSVVGVSAGALFGVNYLSGQKGRVIRYNKRFNKDKNYMGFRPLLREGNIVSTKYAYEDVPKTLDPFDDEAYKKSNIPFYAVVTNVATGNPEYIQIDSVFEQMDTLRASGSMPFVSKPVAIGDKKYLDGGIADSIPFEWLSGQGCDKLIVILTRDMEYRKRPMSPILVKLYGRKYPKIAERLLQRHNNYNRAVEELRKWEAGGKAMVIRPSSPIEIGRIEKNPDKLQAVYELGVKDGKVKQITQPTKLTPELVHEFIEKIVIHEPRHLDGKRYQLMDIYYNGVGVIRGLTPEEMEEAFQEHLIKRKHNKVKTA